MWGWIAGGAAVLYLLAQRTGASAGVGSFAGDMVTEEIIDTPNGPITVRKAGVNPTAAKPATAPALFNPNTVGPVTAPATHTDPTGVAVAWNAPPNLQNDTRIQNIDIPAPNLQNDTRIQNIDVSPAPAPVQPPSFNLGGDMRIQNIDQVFGL